MKPLLKPGPCLALCLILNGCASFTTTQIDEREGDFTRISTVAKAWTLFSSKSSLATWTAAQTEKSQGAKVGGLTQQGSTNVVDVLGHIEGIIKALRP